MTILVTGSSGFIGTHCVEHLVSLGHKVYAYDLTAPKQKHPKGAYPVIGDIRSAAFPNVDFDAVVHLAALAGVRPSMDKALTYNTTNVHGTLRLLEYCRIRNIKRFVFASSSSVYGPTNPLPFTEDDQCSPCSPYAASKLIGEQYGDLYTRLYDLRFVALRFFSVYGEGQRSDLALESFKRSMERGTQITINGDGSSRRDLTHVDDAVKAISAALTYNGNRSSIFNVGTGVNHSVMDMVNEARALTGKDADIKHVDAHPADVPETLASTDKASAELGWSSTINFAKRPPKKGVNKKSHLMQDLDRGGKSQGRKRARK